MQIYLMIIILISISTAGSCIYISLKEIKNELSNIKEEFGKKQITEDFNQEYKELLDNEEVFLYRKS